MLVFLIIFFGVSSFATAILGALFASTEAITYVCALLIFAFIALAIGSKNNRAWTWMFLTVIVMVAVEVLAPFAKFIVGFISAIIAGYGTYQIKKPILQYLKNPSSRRLGWVRTVLIFI